MIKLFSFKGRELYHQAWKFMYFSNKEMYQDKIYDEVNPLANKQLGTELEVWSVVAFDDEILSWDADRIAKYSIDNSLAIRKSGIDIMERGIPVGIQSWVITKSKIIGKQMIVAKNYEGRGICTAMIIENGMNLKGAKKPSGEPFDYAYIGCSSFSSPIFKYKFGLEPFSSSVEHDLYKYNVPMDMLTNQDLHDKFVAGRGIGIYS